MIYLNTPYALVEWDEDLRAVRIEWRGFADGSEYRETHNKILEVLKAHSGSKMLADARWMRAVAPEDQAWVQTDWVPRTRPAGLRYSALVVPKSAVAQLSLQRIVAGSPPPPTDGDSAYFDNVEDAKKWLRKWP
jgi:hypothetical protein